MKDPCPTCHCTCYETYDDEEDIPKSFEPIAKFDNDLHKTMNKLWLKEYGCSSWEEWEQSISDCLNKIESLKRENNK